MNATTAADLIPHCHGVIVGTSLKHAGVPTNAVDPGRVKAVVAAIRAAAEK